MLDLVAEGSPYTWIVILFGLAATTMAVLQCLARTKPWSGIVVGLLAAHLAIMVAFLSYCLATSLSATAGADAASKATILAFGISATGSVFLVGGGLGALAATVAVLGALLGPDRRAELALRAAAFGVTFGAMAEMARRMKFTMSVIAGSDPENRGAIALAGLGESFAVIPIALALVTLLVIAAGVASTRRPAAA